MARKPIAWVVLESASEPLDSKIKIVNEEKRRLTALCTLQSANVVNRNSRLYESVELFPVLKQQRITEFLRTSGVPAENGHPLDQSAIRQQTIDPDNVVAEHIKIWTEGNLIKSWTRGSNNALGEAFDWDLRDGKLPAWSFRGLGTVVNENGVCKVKRITAITWDRVYFPSHPEAYTEGIVNESGIWIPNEYDWKTPMPETNQKINESGILIPLMQSDVKEYIKKSCKNLRQVKESFDLYYTDISITESGIIQLKDEEYGQVYFVRMEEQLHNEMMNYANSKILR